MKNVLFAVCLVATMLLITACADKLTCPAGNNATNQQETISCSPSVFSDSTTFTVNLRAGETGTLDILNPAGQLVRHFTLGSNQLMWNGTNEQGNLVASGVYFFKLSTPSMSVTKKLIIIQ